MRTLICRCSSLRESLQALQIVGANVTVDGNTGHCPMRPAAWRTSVPFRTALAGHRRRHHRRLDQTGRFCAEAVFASPRRPQTLAGTARGVSRVRLRPDEPIYAVWMSNAADADGKAVTVPTQVQGTSSGAVDVCQEAAAAGSRWGRRVGRMARSRSMTSASTTSAVRGRSSSSLSSLGAPASATASLRQAPQGSSSVAGGSSGLTMPPAAPARPRISARRLRQQHL